MNVLNYQREKQFHTDIKYLFTTKKFMIGYDTLKKIYKI